MNRRLHHPVFPYGTHRPNARWRLLLFPFAGAGAQALRPLVEHVPPDMDGAIYEPPGRGTRFREALPGTLGDLAAEVVAAVGASSCGRPIVLLGHSMGATLAWEVAQGLEAAGAQVDLLVVSGSGPPGPPPRRDPFHVLPDDELIDALQDLGGTPPEVLAEVELMNLLLPIIRGDLRMSETHEATPGRVGSSILAIGGDDDPFVEKEDLEAWCEGTRSRCVVKVVEGDHFFLLSTQPRVMAEIAAILESGVE